MSMQQDSRKQARLGGGPRHCCCRAVTATLFCVIRVCIAPTAFLGGLAGRLISSFQFHSAISHSKAHFAVSTAIYELKSFSDKQMVIGRLDSSPSGGRTLSSQAAAALSPFVAALSCKEKTQGK